MLTTTTTTAPNPTNENIFQLMTVGIPAHHQDSQPTKLNRNLEFTLPPELEAGEPPEARGMARDEVRLMVSYQATNQVAHTQFRNLPDYLEAGDVVVINTSGTLNAALNATRSNGTKMELHMSTQLPANLWIVEVRQPDGTTTQPFYQATAGEIFTLPNRATATLLTPYLAGQRTATDSKVRLWIATLQLPENTPVVEYLSQNGFPISK